MPSGLSNVQAIYSTSYAFALKQDGSVAAWGSSLWRQRRGLSNEPSILLPVPLLP